MQKRLALKPRPTSKKVPIVVGLTSVGVIAIVNAVRWSRYGSLKEFATSIYTRAAQAIDWDYHWWRLPTLPAILVLLAARTVYRQKNLYDTGVLPTVHPVHPEPLQQRYVTARTPDGTYNDLHLPSMGAANMRFGRNVPLDETAAEVSSLFDPNPRVVSHDLLTRDTFRPATILNLLAAAWLQFMVHDWLSHGKNVRPAFEVDVEDDAWSGPRPMPILRTRPDHTRPPHPDEDPVTFLNIVTHWWDASQIYGSHEHRLRRLRSFTDGKMHVQSNGLLPLDPEFQVDLTGVNGNYWLGLSMLHTLFTREHNAICDRLKQEYPHWTDEQLFDKARLINAALLAKIHTVEWTPAILPNPTAVTALRGNWWGIEGETLSNALGRLSHVDLVSGIPGSDTEQHAAPYSITEEFVSVYRMHPLIPDELSFRSAVDDSPIRTLTFREVSFQHSRTVAEEISMSDLFYSFATLNPGAVTLHNYPRFMQELIDENQNLIDLAATDILRVRERGVPRYNRFRELMHLPRVNTFEELTDNPEWAEQIRRVYHNDIDKVDLMVGLYAEPLPPGFGFSDTAFRIFVLMASRRLKSDRFFTVDFTPAVYTPVGMQWIEQNSLLTVLQRHHPDLGPRMRTLTNAFKPWPRVQAHTPA
ncbi:MAG: peroxidase [Chloroflexi bacterium]|nr:peroxidase [Chloroflexota bacterium]